MRVLFDFSLGADDHGGPRTLMRGLLQGWQEAFPDDHLSMFGEAQLAEGMDIEFTVPTSAIPPKRITQQQIELPLFRRRLAKSPDVIVVPNIGCTLLPLGPPILGTLNDLRHLARPQDFSAQSLHYRNRAWPAFSKRMKGVIAISEFSLREAERLGFPLPPVQAVATLGADHVPSKLGANCDHRRIICVAHRSSKRPLELARIALDLQKAELGNIEILVTGVQDDETRTAVQDEFKKLGVVNSPTFAGFLSTKELHSSIASSEALVYLSHYEGFGLVPTEATRLGTRTFTYDLEPYTERSSELLLTTAPVGDHGLLAERLATYLSSPSEQSETAPTQTSWRDTAAIYRATADRILH